jgi:hypothetical protein
VVTVEDLARRVIRLHEQLKSLQAEYDSLKARLEDVMVASNRDSYELDGYRFTRVTQVRASPRDGAAPELVALLEKHGLLGDAIQVRSGFLTKVVDERPGLLMEIVPLVDITKTTFLTVRKVG